MSETEPSVFEALRKITTKASRRLYVSHLRFIVFDEQTAREGISNMLDFLFRDHEVRPDFYVAVAKNCRAKDVIGFVSPTEKLSGIDMYRSLKTSEKVWSPTSAANVKDLMIALSKKGMDPAITGLSLIGNIERGKTEDNVKSPISLADFKFEGIGVFRKDRLLGWLDEDESKAYSYITNHIKSTAGRVKCPDGKSWFTAELTKSKVKITPIILEGKPHVKMKADIEANLDEMQCSVDIMDPQQFTTLENLAHAQVMAILNDGMRKVQQYGADIFGFGEAFHRKFPKQWRSWKDNWHERFKNDLTYEIEMDYRLIRHGKINNIFDDHTNGKEQE
ncbi:Ger(x)C family spore germination protein [Paenibacillus sp. DYY-L-2]|uniref:Ger(x)C family spore germination protein n=1 Tax=Paenibacillus sp. DYY-L-2 TaxID=3447013 RepID=UPI003F4FD5B1